MARVAPPKTRKFITVRPRQPPPPVLSRAPQRSPSEMSDAVEDGWYERSINGAYASAEPVIYGPISWTYLHHWTLRYPVWPTEDQRFLARNFLNSFINQEGCVLCVLHMANYMREKPVDFTSRLTLVRWMREAHNEVNRRKKKPIMSEMEFLDVYVDKPRREVNRLLEKERKEQKRRKGLTTEEAVTRLDPSAWRWLGPLLLFVVLALFVCGLVVVHNNGGFGRWFGVKRGTARARGRVSGSSTPAEAFQVDDGGVEVRVDGE